MRNPLGWLPRTMAVGIAAFGMGCAYAADSTNTGIAPWLVQIGLTPAIASAGNWGTGQVLGVVDTGIVNNATFFAPGQISLTRSGCAANSFRCPNGYVDDNNHGTAVAAIAAGHATAPFGFRAGAYSVKKGDLISVAPNANIVAEKVLNVKGSGTSGDVANGIVRAVDSGASVINLSLSYVATADVVRAINYAASKNAIIVWAGGNSSTALNSGRHTTGLSKEALRRIVFVGSVDAGNQKSTFSNVPGSGLLFASGNSASYASRWISAPGESIAAPYKATGSSIGLWTGTSMSTPLVSGSLILLESAWPILRTRGTAADLLLATASDLGAPKVDTTYGVGIVDLGRAFQPYGALTITTLKGTTVPVANVTGQLLTSGMFGALPGLQNRLSAYQAFDGYTRNYSVNLSGLIQPKRSAAYLNPLPTNVNKGVRPMNFADGSKMVSWHAAVESSSDRDSSPAIDDETPNEQQHVGYFALTTTRGKTMALGYGVSSQLSFAQTLYANDDLAWLAGGSDITGMTCLTEGGYHLAYGQPIIGGARLGFAYSQSLSQIAQNDWAGAPMPITSSVMTALTYPLNDHLTTGISLGQYSEQRGMLGLQYEAGSLFDLGATHSHSTTFSVGYDLGPGASLLVEAGYVQSMAGGGEGLLLDTHDVQGRAWAVSFLSRQLLDQRDSLTVRVGQPMRISTGTVGMQVASVDEDGNPVYSVERISLVPSGRQFDSRVTYDLSPRKNHNFSVQFATVRDAQNVSGANEMSFGLVWRRRL